MRWALLVAAAAAAPDLSKCRKTPPPAVEGCAAEWAALRKTQPAPARRIVVSFLFRDMAPARLVQFLEYYLALGATDFVVFDNSCPAAATPATLAPYVAAGLVKYDKRLVCGNIRKVALDATRRDKNAHGRDVQGASAIAQQLMRRTPSLNPPRGSVVLSLDDDEFVVAEDGLAAAADRMAAAGSCASFLQWRLFGTSGHVCQPDAALVSAFTRRAPLHVSKANASLVAKAKRNAGAYPVQARGKIMQLWSPSGKMQCGTHLCHGSCDAGKLANCAGGGGKCRPWRRPHIAHYAIQSLEHWEYKKRRGRTSNAKARTGPPLPLYDAEFDDGAARGLARRVGALGAPALAACLGTRVFPAVDFGGGNLTN